MQVQIQGSHVMEEKSREFGFFTANSLEGTSSKIKLHMLSSLNKGTEVNNEDPKATKFLH